MPASDWENEGIQRTNSDWDRGIHWDSGGIHKDWNSGGIHKDYLRLAWGGTHKDYLRLGQRDYLRLGHKDYLRLGQEEGGGPRTLAP